MRAFERTVSVKGQIPYLHNILLWDDFEELFRWDGSGNAGDWAVEKTTKRSYIKSASMRIATRVTSPAAGDWAKATRHSYVIRTATLKGACHWLMTDDTAIDYVEFLWTLYSGTYRYQAGIRYFPGTGKAYYLDETGAWTDTGAPGQYLAKGAWHRFSLSVDYYKRTYLELESDGLTGSLEDKSLYIVPDTSRVELLTELSVITAGAAQAEIFIDTFLIEAL